MRSLPSQSSVALTVSNIPKMTGWEKYVRNIMGWDDDEAALVVVIPSRDPGDVTADVRN